MRLKRIEAVRFGGLADCTLGDLGEGLTVVTGPNEAGKSTFTHLVRYMLYGFPTEGSKQQPPFLSPLGDREGRLVFVDSDSEWVVTRTHGPRGGPSTVKALSGTDRGDLVEEITRGVSPAEYRVVFGFGLDELAEIERERGSENDIISRLYAAGAGITISPQEVRADIEKRALELFAPRGKNREINTVLRQIRDTRGQIRDLEREAQEFADAAAKLSDLGANVDRARQERDKTAASAGAAAHSLEKAESLAADLMELERELSLLDEQLSEIRGRRDRSTPDPEIIAADSRISALVEDVSAARERRERIAALQAEIKRQEAAISAALDRIGLDSAVAEAADIGPETLAGLESRKRKITGLESELSLAEREAGRRADALARLQSEATGSDTSAGATGSKSGLAVAAVLAVVGVSVAVLGYLSGDMANYFVSAVLIAIAVFLVVSSRAGQQPASSQADDRVRASDAQRDSLAAEDALARVSDSLEQALTEWREWLASRSLSPAGDDPEAISMLVSDLKELRGKREALDQSKAQLEGELATLATFTNRVAELVDTLIPDAGEVTHERALELTARLASLRDLALTQRAERERAEIELRSATERAESLRKRLNESAAALTQLLADCDSEDIPALKAIRDCAAADARSAAESFEQIKEEHDRLSASLDSEGRAKEMTDARLIVAGLKERLNTLSGEYAVLALAMRLLDQARNRYERERQPDVIREAEAVFSKITDGRYERLTVPLSDGSIEVFDAAAAAKPTADLSRGTAEQLYLALRIALIQQMGDVGCSLPIIMDDIFVNFDEERRRGAVEAVVDLARTRQVIVFTCHPETADLFAATASDVTTLTLDRC